MFNSGCWSSEIIENHFHNVRTHLPICQIDAVSWHFSWKWKHWIIVARVPVNQSGLTVTCQQSWFTQKCVCVELKLLLSPARSLACKIYCLQNTCWWIMGDFTAESQKSIRKCKLVSSPHHKCQLCVCLCVNVWEEREFSTFPFQCALHFWARVKNVLKVWSGAFHCDPSSHQTLV